MRKNIMLALACALGLAGAASAQTTTTSTTTTTTRTMSMPMHQPMMRGQMMRPGTMRASRSTFDVYIDHHRFVVNAPRDRSLRLIFPKPGTHTVEVVRLAQHSRSNIVYRRTYHTTRIGQSEYLNLRQIGLR